MPIFYVARSAKLGRWASDVGLGKNIYKVGVAEGDPKALAAAGWAGETDWTIVRKTDGRGVERGGSARSARPQGKDDRSEPLPKAQGRGRGRSG